MTTKEPQFFTLEAANALVPQLSNIVEKQLGRRADIEERLKTLSLVTGEEPTELTPPDPGDPPPVRKLKRELFERIGAYQEGWSAVEELGAVLKDPRLGLIDFYGHVEGKAVWLCWRFGEVEIAHYHALDEGFSARKPIGASLKRSLLN
jgi:hypothetical protein